MSRSVNTEGGDIYKSGAGGGGATDFLALTDTPASYVGSALKAVTVNAGETGLQFETIPNIDVVKDQNELLNAVNAQSQVIFASRPFTVTGLTLEFKVDTFVCGAPIQFVHNNPTPQVFMRIRDGKYVLFDNEIEFNGSGTSAQIDVTTVGGYARLTRIIVDTIPLLIDDGVSLIDVRYEDQTLLNGGTVTTVGGSATYIREVWHSAKTKITGGSGITVSESLDSVQLSTSGGTGLAAATRIVNLANADTTVKQTQYIASFTAKALCINSMTVSKMLFHLNSQWATGVSPAGDTFDKLGVAIYNADGTVLHASRDVDEAGTHFTNTHLVSEGNGIWSLAFSSPYTLISGTYYNLTMKAYQTSGTNFDLSGKTLITNTVQPAWSIGHEWFGASGGVYPVAFPASITITTPASKVAVLAAAV